MTVTRHAAAGLALVLLVSVAPGTAGAATRVPGPGAGPVTAAPLPAPPGRTTLLSQARNGGFPDGGSLEPSMSADGRFVAFTSIATDLVRNDDEGTVDVFALDRRTGRVTRAPLPDGAVRLSGATSSEPSISANGRFVAFTYMPPATTSHIVRRLIVIWDRRDGSAVYASTNSRGTPLPGSQPSISADGRFVAYTSIADVDGDKDDGQDDVLRFDRRENVTVLVTPGFNGEPISGYANAPSISGDGNLVAFVSDGGDSVVDEDTGSGRQVYVRNVAAGRSELISATASGGPARADSFDPAISGDGRYVAFVSLAGNITAQGTGGLFRRDRQADTTVMVSVTPAGAAGEGSHTQPSITTDGNMIAWTSTGTDLVPESAGRIAPAAVARGQSDVFIRDLAAGETLLISVSLANGRSLGRSFQPAIGGGGRFVAFGSDSEVLVRDDDNKAYDVFLRDLPPAPVINPATLDLGARAVATESLPLAATLGNAGWSPLRVTGATITGTDDDDFDIVADGCTGRLLRRNEACTVSVVFRPTSRGSKAATLAIADSYQGSPRTVRLRGRASQGRLMLSPTIGRPGVVTIVEGSGFPPGTGVRLTWSLGITGSMDPIVTDARGRFRVPMLVFHNDRTGPRELVAEALDGAAFPSVAASMLVTKPPVVPPRFEILRLIDVPLVLVFRG